MISVKEIESGSLGERAGMQIGDKIRAVNGEAIGDLIDFQVHGSDPYLRIEIERRGRVCELEVERIAGEALGLHFEDMPLRRCNNQCVFCFIHQMPRGMRRSLYFEDDDYRLSFLHGSYVTLTNVKDADLDRIIAQGLSPQYISVHATEVELRQKMLGRTKPTVDIMERLRLLAAHHIEMHTQVVLCPGWNDGPHLRRTVRDLSTLYPALRSVALVPVGLTRFRQRLSHIEPVTPERARRYTAAAQEWGRRFEREWGERFVYAADELFLSSGCLPPPRSYYDAFPQLENGIGMVRSFLDTWERRRGSLAAAPGRSRRIALVTGMLARTFMAPIAAELNALGWSIDLVAVPNDFFGRRISVSGLLTGRDILEHLGGGSWDLVLLPPNCINGEGLTLDDMSVPALERAAGVPVAVGSYDLAAALQMRWPDTLRGSGRQLSELGYYVGRKRDGGAG